MEDGWIINQRDKGQWVLCCYLELFRQSRMGALGQVKLWLQKYSIAFVADQEAMRTTAIIRCYFGLQYIVVELQREFEN